MPASSDIPVGAVEASVVLEADLHARPAGAVSVAAAPFTATVRLTAGDREADAKSVLSVMQLGATSGGTVTIRASGPDAAEAVAAVAGALSAASQAS